MDRESRGCMRWAGAQPTPPEPLRDPGVVRGRRRGVGGVLEEREVRSRPDARSPWMSAPPRRRALRWRLAQSTGIQGTGARLIWTARRWRPILRGHGGLRRVRCSGPAGAGLIEATIGSACVHDRRMGVVPAPRGPASLKPRTRVRYPGPPAVVPAPRGPASLKLGLPTLARLELVGRPAPRGPASLKQHLRLRLEVPVPRRPAPRGPASLKLDRVGHRQRHLAQSFRPAGAGLIEARRAVCSMT